MKILADLHAHCNKTWGIKAMLEIASKGVVGLTTYPTSTDLFTYEDLVNDSHVTEIDKGRFAMVQYGGRVGYIVNVQEVPTEENFHTLCVGVSQRIIPGRSLVSTITKIQGEIGGAVINHPYVQPTGHPLIRYGLIQGEKEKILEEGASVADAIEVYNGQNINFLPVIAWMAQANEQAQELANAFNKPGTAASDTHYMQRQVLTSGILIDEEYLCLDALLHYLKQGQFETVKGKISRPNFWVGHFGKIVQAKTGIPLHNI